MLIRDCLLATLLHVPILRSLSTTAPERLIRILICFLKLKMKVLSYFKISNLKKKKLVLLEEFNIHISNDKKCYSAV